MEFHFEAVTLLFNKSPWCPVKSLWPKAKFDLIHPMSVCVSCHAFSQPCRTTHALWFLNAVKLRHVPLPPQTRSAHARFIPAESKMGHIPDRGVKQAFGWPPLLKHKEIFLNDLPGQTKIITCLLSLSYSIKVETSFWNLQPGTVHFCLWRSFTAEILHNIPLTWLLKPSCDLFSTSMAACRCRTRWSVAEIIFTIKQN